VPNIREIRVEGHQNALFPPSCQDDDEVLASTKTFFDHSVDIVAGLNEKSRQIGWHVLVQLLSSPRRLSMEGQLLLFSGEPSGISERGAKILRLQDGVLTEDLCFRLTSGQMVEDDRHHDPSALDARLSMADVRVDRDPVFPVLRRAGSVCCRFLAHGH
jgi:hypothetical protein